ncbi:aldolase [Candidatus Saccharibacteria bacterium]|nr:aldolase [Candidatus Saccharibacteria bacterium]
MVRTRTVPVLAFADHRNGVTFTGNINSATGGTGYLNMIAHDQRTEHFAVSDFYGPEINPGDLDPEWGVKIARESNSPIACHPGLINRYGKKYPDVNFIVKMNTKTDLSPKDARSALLCDMEHVAKLSDEVNIVGCGWTLYTGSEHEDLMLAEIQRGILDAHSIGLFTVLWHYPRGAGVAALFDNKEKCAKILEKNDVTAEVAINAINAAGVANGLGADYVKLNPPKDMTAEQIQMTVTAAGNTGVMFAGGAKRGVDGFLENLIFQMDNGAAGAATGRNYHQAENGIALAKVGYDIIVGGVRYLEVAKGLYSAYISEHQ